MTEAAADLLAHLRMLDVTVGVDGDNLQLNAARGVLTAELRGDLAAHKADLIALLKEGVPQGVRIAPASFAQRRMWLLDRIQGDTAAYNIPGLLQLDGDLDAAALARAIEEIVRRHDVFRTTFEVVNGEPVQQIRERHGVSLETLDFTEFVEAERERHVREFVRVNTSKPFDLERGPLARLHLVRVSPRRHLLLAVAHHIISDGWSMGVFVRELTVLFSSYRAGTAPALGSLKAQYSDFARWERRRFAGSEMDSHLDYWRQKLASPFASADLPPDRPRPPQMRFVGTRQSFPFRHDLTPALRDLAAREDATLFMVLLTVFKVLLYRYSTQTDVLVGTPVANRTSAATEDLIGFFVNTLVLRSDLSGDPTFRDLLRQVRATVLDAFAHQDVPFEKLVEVLAPERDQSRNPFFQTMFILRYAEKNALDLPGVVATIPEVADTGSSKFDLTAIVTDTEGRLSLELEYSTDLFDRETIGHFSDSFSTLIESVVMNPDASVGRLDVLSGAQHQLLHTWNATGTDHDLRRGLHQLVEAQVDRTPNAIAVQFDDATVTYSELDARANRLAHKLRGHGTGRLIGVFMERSVEMVISLLAILKSGNGYVPIDPDTPPERLRFFLADSGVTLVLTQEKFLSALRSDDTVTLAVDAGGSSLDELPADRVPFSADENSVAYMIYTSGSTGRPKGALNSHRGIVNRILWMQDAEPLGADDRVLQKTPYSFDVSVQEFFWTLASGARLVVARPEGHKDPGYLAGVIRRESITSVHFVPSMLAAFLTHEDVVSCTSLRRVLTSGEALSADLRDMFFSRLTCRLRNLYGPTEAAVDVTSWVCAPDESRRSVPIGRPIANTQIHLLDPFQRPVPICGIGELYIGGANVGLGYHNRPELTAERFIRDPFDGNARARLYRTGDLARYWADGAIEFLGRKDFQVKVRGFRIELGEIESVLASDPRVQSATVIVREDVPGDRRIVGYVVTKTADRIEDELRTAARARLPEYMVPSSIVALAQLPLTPSGKIDRRALPQPEHSARSVGPRQAAATDLERGIARIWSNALGVPDVDVNQNFFDLGGHSLLLIRVHAEIRTLVSREVTVVDLFRYTTVRSLARFLGEAGSASPRQNDFTERAQKQRQSQRMRARRDVGET